MVEIKNRYTGEVICSGETLRECVTANLRNLRWANLGGANLSGADLRGADLRGAYLGGANLSGAYLGEANLSGANLREANLREAYLSGANLREAYLGEANLSGANLREANLREAYLGGANLRGAYLGGAKLAWQSHDLLAEILRRSAGDDLARLKVAGLILVMRDKCWKHFAEIAASDPLGDWALDTLAEWVQPGDGAPEIVRERVKSPAASN